MSRSKVLTMYLDTWYGEGKCISSDKMIFGNGLFDSLGYDEIHIPLELYRDDKLAAESIIRRKFPYEMAFVVPFQDVITEIREYVGKAPVVAWMCDDVWRYSSFGRYWAAVSDVIATTSPEAAEKYGPKGHLTNWAARKEWMAFAKEYKAPAVYFPGQMYGNRKQRVSELKSAGSVPVLWRDSSSDQTTEEQYFESISNHAFSLCLTESSHGIRQMKSRLFEPQVVGSILVTEDTPGLSKYWEAGKECIVYDTPESAQAQMAELMGNQESFDRMRISALDRILSEHTYQHRFAAIFDRLGVKA